MKKVIAACFLLFFLSGCWDKHEIEEQAFVIAIGVDKGNGPNNIKLTYLIANPPVGLPNAGGQREPNEEVITFNAPDYVSARDLANATVTRKINFSHAKVLVVGSKFAKTDKFFKYMRGSIRDREIRRELNLIISKEEAYKFLKNNNPPLETRPHKYYDLMSVRWKETGLVPYSTLQKFFEKSEGDADGFLAILASTQKSDVKKKGEEDEYVAGQANIHGGNPTEMIGSALVRDGKMIDELNGQETRIALNLREEPLAKYMYVTYKDPLSPKYRIAVRLTHLRKTTINMNTKTQPMEIHVVVPMELYVAQITSGVNYATNLKNQHILKEAVRDDLKSMMMNLIEKSQKEYKIDLFNWSHVARMHFLTRQAYEKFNWREKYQHAVIHVSIDLRIEGFGNQLIPPQVNEKE